ncbi:hypothetical protein PHISP_01020 [Aspergillus sp. HF37]|nr:hypothetical protein PHISP_01020 [Aspergillus sp. HF37]
MALVEMLHAASNQVKAILKELAPKTASGEPTADAPVTVFSVGCLRSWSERLYSDNPKPRALWHYARVSIEATFRDSAKLAEVTPKLLAMPNVESRRSRLGT